MNILIRVFIGLVVVLAGMPAAASSGYSFETYPATHCRATFPLHEQRLMRSQGVLINGGAQAVDIVCPITSHEGRQRDVIRVSLSGRQPSEAVPTRCFLTTQHWSTRKSHLQTRSSAGTFNLYLGLYQMTRYDTLHIGCRIPPGGELWKYFVDEYAPLL